VNSRFSSYLGYRPSGIEWIGDIPHHWIVAALTYRYHVQLGKMLDEKRITGDHLAPYLRNTDVQWDDINFEDLPLMDFDADDRRRYSLREGDLLVCEGGEVGRAAIWGRPIAECYYQKALHRVRPKSETEVPRFLLYALRAAASAGALVDNTGKATIDHLPAERLRMVRFPFASADEQYAIAAFLDHETAKIDALIEKQQQLIELLEEKRQAILTHVVAKGIDPRAPLKPSGIEWLGEVPSHWQLKRFKEVLQEVDDRSEEGSEELLSVSHITGVTPRSEKTVYMFEAETKEGYKRCEAGDLVVNTMWAWMGALGVSPYSGIVSPSYNVYRARRTDVFDPRFLDLLCRIPPLVAFIKSISTGVWTSRLRLYPETLFNISFAAPPMQEQQAIVAMVERENSLARRTIAAATAAISLLEEHRASLITAAVTGKIDVRRQSATASQRDRVRLRVLVAAEITHRHQGVRRFGRVKLQKLLYLAEAHASIHELQGNYLREAAGPLDRGLIIDAERGMAASRYFETTAQDRTGNGVSYRALPEAGKQRVELTNLLGTRETALTRIIDLLRDLDTRASEVITTIYAVWNDAMLDGENPDDDWIVRAFLNDWHPEKRQKFKEREVRHWLRWMKRNSVVPVGIGPRTISTVPRDMFHDL
jgi:type I restriction enzyme, S subunit